LGELKSTIKPSNVNSNSNSSHPNASLQTKYRQSLLLLLSKASNTPKITYNLLKLLVDEKIPQVEMVRWRVAENVERRVKGGQWEVQALGYAVLVQNGRVGRAVEMFKGGLVEGEGKGEIAEKFLSVLARFGGCDVDRLLEIKGILAEYSIAPPTSYYRILTSLLPNTTDTFFL
jgi:hypothetical protein